MAAAHVRRHHDLRATVGLLASFLADVFARKDALLSLVGPGRAPAGSLQAYLADEIRWTALDLGLDGIPAGCEALLADLAGTSR